MILYPSAIMHLLPASKMTVLLEMKEILLCEK